MSSSHSLYAALLQTIIESLYNYDAHHLLQHLVQYDFLLKGLELNGWRTSTWNTGILVRYTRISRMLMIQTASFSLDFTKQILICYQQNLQRMTLISWYNATAVQVSQHLGTLCFPVYGVATWILCWFIKSYNQTELKVQPRLFYIICPGLALVHAFTWRFSWIILISCMLQSFAHNYLSLYITAPCYFIWESVV